MASQTVFTTHTPVAAGHDRFPASLVEEHLGPLREALGLSLRGLHGARPRPPGGPGEPFCMTVLALKLSRHANGVSRPARRVSRRMWQPLWPEPAEDEVPIGHITNGVHVPTWLAPQMQELYDRHLGVDWAERSSDPRRLGAASTTSTTASCGRRTRSLKARLIDFVRRAAGRAAARRGEPARRVAEGRRRRSTPTP